MSADLTSWLELFGTSAEELELNRGGQLSPRQREGVSRATSGDAIWMLGMAVVFSAVMGGVFYMYASSAHFRVSDGLDLTEVGLSALMLGMPLSAVLWAAYTLWIHFRHRDSTVVQARRGPVAKRVRRWRHAEIHSIEVGGESFDVAPKVFEPVVPGGEYALYFVPGARVVVMIEPLGKEKAKPTKRKKKKGRALRP